MVRRYHFLFNLWKVSLTFKLKRKEDSQTQIYKIHSVGHGIYKKGINGVFLCCVAKSQQIRLLNSFHNLACGGNFSSFIISYKILQARYYWPTLFRDSKEWVAKCKACLHFIGRPKMIALPLKPVVIEEHFH